MSYNEVRCYMYRDGQTFCTNNDIMYKISCRKKKREYVVLNLLHTLPAMKPATVIAKLLLQNYFEIILKPVHLSSCKVDTN